MIQKIEDFVFIPKPIGPVYCHRQRTIGPTEHHESQWVISGAEIISVCSACGKTAKVLDMDVPKYVSLFLETR